MHYFFKNESKITHIYSKMKENCEMRVKICKKSHVKLKK